MPRIRKARWKLIYILGAIALTNLVGLVWLRLPAPLPVIVSQAWLVANVLVGTRWFRGRGEAIAPPRPWWRMTARPPAGFIIGGIFLVGFVTELIVPSDPRVSVWEGVTGMITFGGLAALYIHSSLRLIRTPPPFVADPPPLPPALPPWRPLKR